MTININSLWVVIGIGIALGFGGYIGLYAAIILIKTSEWLGAKLGDLILYLISLVKRRKGKDHGCKN